mmetsp:Transcript_44385/g.78604  ORF Transcript_44385/g.78604 Transcript_44385/m.78604 type:complete len:129 (-) Transcript_44385:284-670(-)
MVARTSLTEVIAGRRMVHPCVKGIAKAVTVQTARKALGMQSVGKTVRNESNTDVLRTMMGWAKPAVAQIIRMKILASHMLVQIARREYALGAVQMERLVHRRTAKVGALAAKPVVHGRNSVASGLQNQ